MTQSELLAVFDPHDRRNAEAQLERIRRTLLRFFEWRNMPDAEDLVQTVLTRGFEKIAGGTEVYADDPGGFFYGIAKNVLHEASRNSAREKRGPEPPGPRTYAPGPVLNPLDTKIYLKEILGLLDKEERDLLTRYTLGHGLSGGISSRALRLRVHRIRKKLAKLRKK